VWFGFGDSSKPQRSFCTSEQGAITIMLFDDKSPKMDDNDATAGPKIQEQQKEPNLWLIKAGFVGPKRGGSNLKGQASGKNDTAS
jgi:hypothetical protein